MDKNKGATTKKDNSDFEHLREWQDNPDLDYYLSEDHWNFHVNQLLYKNLLVYHGGKEVGAFLDVSRDSFTHPINDYTHLYGEMFNEAYRLCSCILVSPVPETKVAFFAKQAATWKFRNLKDEQGKPIMAVPNVIDLIESYHILGMTTAILSFANDQKDTIDRFLLALSVYKDKGLPFMGYIHCFESYNDVYRAFIVATLISCSELRPDYDYKKRDEHLRYVIPLYKIFADEVEKKKMKETKVNMEQTVLDKISANNIRFYYEGWRNGKHGSICQRDGVYRFIEQARGKAGLLDDIKRNEDDNPIAAVGIVAYWLMFNSKKELVLKRLTQYKNGNPQDIREMFDNYTKERFVQFKAVHRDDPNTWDWDWEHEFYAKYIIPHEIELNRISEALFDYISDSDINLVKAVMKNYIKYLKKCRIEKGYRVSPELLVLRAVASQDDTKYEDLEDYEVNTILDKLEGEGFIRVAWISGHRPEGTRMLDKGRAYLKQLEEGEGVIDVALVETPQPISEEYSKGTTSQMTRSNDKSEHDQDADDEEWDDTYDYIFDERVKPWELKKALEGIKYPTRISQRRFYYVTYRILDVIKYFSDKVTPSDFLRWINLHFNCGWIDDNEHRKQFVFALEGSSKNLEDQHPSDWDEKTIRGGSGKQHRQLAITLKNTFTETMVKGIAVDNSDSFEHLRDRGQYLSHAYHVKDNEYFIPDDAYINNGK